MNSRQPCRVILHLNENQFWIRLEHKMLSEMFRRKKSVAEICVPIILTWRGWQCFFKSSIRYRVSLKFLVSLNSEYWDEWYLPHANNAEGWQTKRSPKLE